MMCQVCCHAADILRDATARGNGDMPVVRASIRDMHSECTNPPTCTCQHRIAKSQKEIDGDNSSRYALVS